MIRVYLGNLISGKFITRINRFVLLAEVNGKKEKVYLRDTGKLRDYLFPGNKILVVRKDKGIRHLLRAVWSNNIKTWVMADPFLDVEMVRLWLKTKGIFATTKNVRIGSSMFDLSWGDKNERCICEVKGANMNKGCAVFPDVYSSRAERHFRTLSMMSGCRWLVFVSHFPTDCVQINPEFPSLTKLLKQCIKNGVSVHALSTRIRGNHWYLEGEVDVKLGRIPNKG